jgi:heme-degrading monooxygenase HmoA
MSVLFDLDYSIFGNREGNVMSVLEIVRTVCVEGKALEMREVLEKAMPVFASAKGCLGAKALQAVESEDPHVFHFLIEWETLEAHLAWRDSDTDSRTWFLENVRPLMGGNNIGGHFVQVAEG